MKINPGFRPLGQELKLTDNASKQIGQKNFSDFMFQQDQQASKEELNQRIHQIHQQGDRLAKSMTVRELYLYRTMVKRFLEDTVRRGLGIKDARGWDRRGRGKRYKLLEEIDSTLIAMAEELLNSEEGKIELLNKIGEVRGMLINYCF
ncbi:YaaR family protein [Paenibacillus terrigena]|uniref:YaaR family protein n=1 Tax=Paenibacillus terrigena TaxID=369333 RepID=UPI00037B62DE|nr:YaaR family protein [Paenibacillus terrigena]